MKEVSYWHVSVSRPMRKFERTQSVTAYLVAAENENKAREAVAVHLVATRTEGTVESAIRYSDLGTVVTLGHYTRAPKRAPKPARQPAPTAKPLGRAQLHVLSSLNGSFWPGSGWTWDNDSGTRRILESLRLRLLAQIDPATDRYTITDAGRAALAAAQATATRA